MRKTRRPPCFAILVGALLCVPVPGTAKADPDSLALFGQALEQDGYSVTPGAVEVWNMAREWCEGKREHAWYANDAPYLKLMAPKVANDPSRLIQDFQLDRDEAIVLIGVTPPPAKYFGYYAWVSWKLYPDGKSRPLVTSVVDPVNHATINTTGSTPFNRPVVLIFTADRRTDARVRAALRRAGYPEATFNTVVFPASVLTLGHDENGQAADVFRIGLRTAIWLDGQEAAGSSYIENAPYTQHLFRVTPAPGGDADPLPMPPLRIRGTGHSELNLWNKLAELRNRIVAAHDGLKATDIPVTLPVGYEGVDEMQRKVLVGGDARDAFCLNAGYLPEFGSMDQQITLADGEFLVVFGVNHVATGKATYMSVNVYTGMVEDGKMAIGAVDDADFPGTARRYLGPGDPASDVMYAYRISRSCEGVEPPCLALSRPQDCELLTLGPTTVLGLLFRMYLEPATKSGAAMQEVLYDRILKFSPRDPASQ